MLSQQPEADALLDRDPLALMIGMVLDQQVPLEKAFSSPWVLAERSRPASGLNGQGRLLALPGRPRKRYPPRQLRDAQP